MVELVVTYAGDNTGNTLSDDSGKRCTGYSHFRGTEETENQDRIQNNIGDCTAELGRHAENRSSGGSQQSLEENLSKQTER